MTEAVIVALITGGLSVLGVIISNIGSNRKIEDALSTSQAVTDCKIEELTREVREHNNFARRMPVVEQQITDIKKDIDELRKGQRMDKKWLKAAGVRAIKTIAQTAVATIGTSAVLGDVDWIMVASASILAGILSVLTSIAGLPEVQQGLDTLA